MNKNVLAINISKLVKIGMSLLNFSATSMPGLVAKKISPQVLSYLMNQTKSDIVAVTGTNGKTTTSNFVAAILKSAGRRVAHNTQGANMLNGVVTAMIDNSDCFGKFNIDNCVVESDEAFLKIFADYFSADYLIVTNLFKDQMDRYGDVNTTAKMLEVAINKFKLHSYELADHMANPQVFTTILNADDPTIQVLADSNSIFFGFDNINFSYDNTQQPAEDITCSCGKTLQYDKFYYGHIGHYHCSCGFKRPATYLKATADIFSNYSVLHIDNSFSGEKFDITVNMPGVYNAYNALAAITFAVKSGIPTQDIINGFSNFKTVFGRAENVIVNGKKVLVQLIKNTVGAQEVLNTVYADKNAKIFIALNDNYGDGRDISWIWDTNFELIKDNTKKIVVSGSRCNDMATRLKYAGIKPSNILIENNLKKAFKLALSNTSQDEKLYVLPSYTALLELNKMYK